ncbi:acyl-CoA dehydrogenase family protein [Streptomyces sp. NPDC096097]|uniref:acyl-CoA dehydrogenase family protein n=1 Tax=Streptomyces sp. NPDC096097 TaxID=3155546 RepID=UPI003316D2F5
MSVLDGRLTALRGQAREWAADFRAGALELDRDPELIKDCLDLPGVRCLSTFGVPPAFAAEAPTVGPYRFDGTNGLERAVVLEEFAAGDIGMTLAAPGPSMSGVLVAKLGDQEQQEWFFGRMNAAPTWTCFALTEPERGSDASALGTALREEAGELRLTGAKRYVGNAARARYAAVFARTRPGPLGVTAVLVDTESEGYHAEPLDSLGIRGAQIGAVSLNGVRVARDRVLGRHLSPARRGIWASLQVFNELRPSVAALALGIAGAAHAYVREHYAWALGEDRDRIEVLGRRIDATRALVHRAAAAVDATGDGYLASAAKARACALAEETTLAACDLLGPAARPSHPLLDKLVRDARGVEFMEGTRNIQHLNLFQGLRSGRVGG